jgi:hypothetical protein
VRVVVLDMLGEHDLEVALSRDEDAITSLAPAATHESLTALSTSASDSRPSRSSKQEHRRRCGRGPRTRDRGIKADCLITRTSRSDRPRRVPTFGRSIHNFQAPVHERSGQSETRSGRVAADPLRASPPASGGSDASVRERPPRRRHAGTVRTRPGPRTGRPVRRLLRPRARAMDCQTDRIPTPARSLLIGLHALWNESSTPMNDHCCRRIKEVLGPRWPTVGSRRCIPQNQRVGMSMRISTVTRSHVAEGQAGTLLGLQSEECKRRRVPTGAGRSICCGINQAQDPLCLYPNVVVP